MVAGPPAAADPRPEPDRRLRVHDRGPRGQGRRGPRRRSPTGSSTRPASGPSWPASSRPFSARVPQLRFDLDRIKARRLDVAVSDVFAVLQANLGGFYVNDFNLYGKVWKVMVQAEGTRAAPSPTTSPSLYVLNRKGDKVPLELAGRGRLRPRADRRAALQHVQRRQDHRPAGPGYSSGQAIAAMEEVADEVLPEGFALRVDRHDVSGAEDRQRGDLHLRPVDRLRLPVHGGPLRELDPPAGHHPDGAAGDVRRDGRPLALRHAARRLRPDRPGDADRPGDEERDPDRRVRRRAAARSTG